MNTIDFLVKHNLLITMKTKRIFCTTYLVAVFSLLLISCDEPQFLVEEPGCTTILLGDKDGFGMGLLLGEPFILPGGTALPIDSRNGNDPLFTDIYPCDMAASSAPTHEVQFEFVFKKPVSITGGTLKLMTLGIQDGDVQVSGSDTEIKLYLDNVEIPGAFDFVDQFDYQGGSWAELSSIVKIEIPSGILPSLNDGKIQVKLEILQLNSDSQSHDGFAIDYCELQVCNNSKVSQ